MYKLLVLDMDGTLLNNNKEISKENIQAIKKAKQQGVKVVIASGRAIQGIESYLEELDLISDDNYSVVCSGSVVMSNTKDKIIQCDKLSYEEVIYLFNLVKKLGINFNMYSNESILIHSNNYFSEIDSIANNLPLKMMDFNSLEEDFLEEDTLITKVMLINEDLSMIKEIQTLYPSIIVDDIIIKDKETYNKELFEDMSKLPKKFLEKFTVSKVAPFLVEIMKKNSSKRSGIEKLAQMLQIKPSEIICIGDSGNDKQMIEYAGLGVAMGNAFPEIKEIADYVTLTNEENGVARVINKFILGEKLD